MKNKIFIIFLVSFVSFTLLGCSNQIKDDNLISSDSLHTEKKMRYVIMEDENGDMYKIYYYGIDSAMITVGDNNYDFEQAILTGTLTLDEILAEMKLYAELNDGGTEIYRDNGSRKYFSDSYTIIKCNTVDGNRDIYIGNNEMVMEEGFCKFKITDAEIKLQREVEKMKSTEKIIIRNTSSHNILNTITDSNKIKSIIDMISHGIESTLLVTSEGTNLVIQMYDGNNKLLVSIYVWKSGYFGFEYDKEYYIDSDDIAIFKSIIDDKK